MINQRNHNSKAAIIMKESDKKLYSKFLLLILFICSTSVQAQLITSHDTFFMPVVPKPAVGTSFTDPVFHTTVRRLSDAEISGNLGIVPQYSKRQAWNANDSLMILLNGDNGYFSLYNGQNYQFIKPLDNPAVGGEDVFWHPTQKNTIIFAADSILMSYDVVTNALIQLHVFTEYSWINTRGEGNLSNDGKYYAFIGQVYNYSTGETDLKDIVVFDLTTNQVVSIMAVSHAAGAGQIDWMSVSPLGNYVVIDYSDLETGRYHGVEVYDRNMNFIWQAPVGYGHSDLGFDGNGDEIMIADCYDEGLNIYHLRKYRLSDGATTNLLDHSWYFDSHISLRNTNRQGWCFISLFDYVGRLTDDSLSWLPFEDEIFALKTDGSGDVQRIAHHHSRRFSPVTPDPDNSVYWAEPHATVNKAGTKVIWGSNWRENMDQVQAVDSYLCDFSSYIKVNELEQAKNLEIEIYPVPCRSLLNIILHLEKSDNLKFSVVDYLGQIVYTTKSIKFKSGKQKFEMDLHHLHSGNYILNAESVSGHFHKLFSVDNN